MTPHHRLLPIAALAFLAACSPESPESEAAAGAAMEAAQGDAASADNGADALDGSDLPDDFARTAWRVEDEDGARYTTYLDEGGRYRDFRNGDPWHSGSWEVDADGRLCLEPESETGDAENGAGAGGGTAPRRCWNPEGMDGDGGMIVQSGSGRRVRLQQTEYRAPQPSDDATEPGATGPA